MEQEDRPTLMKPECKILWLLMLILLPQDVLPCGGAMSGLNRADALATLGMIVFVPMLLLIPAEFAILNYIGKLGSKTLIAYALCMLAKCAALAGVGFAAALGSVPNIFVAEGLYSLIHFLISYGILSFLLRSHTDAGCITAVLISTFIPWAYSASLALLGYSFLTKH
ncbi:MAG: hypothetical protein AAB578_08630 [Elusimicrobiota bacterium]